MHKNLERTKFYHEIFIKKLNLFTKYLQVKELFNDRPQ